MEKKDAQFREMSMHEYYEKADGVVYWIWRFVGEKKWRKEITPFKEIPYSIINYKV